MRSIVEGAATHAMPGMGPKRQPLRVARQKYWHAETRSRIARLRVIHFRWSPKIWVRNRWLYSDTMSGAAFRKGPENTPDSAAQSQGGACDATIRTRTNPLLQILRQRPLELGEIALRSSTGRSGRGSSPSPRGRAGNGTPRRSPAPARLAGMSREGALDDIVTSWCDAEPPSRTVTAKCAGSASPSGRTSMVRVIGHLAVGMDFEEYTGQAHMASRRCTLRRKAFSAGSANAPACGPSRLLPLIAQGRQLACCDVCSSAADRCQLDGRTNLPLPKSRVRNRVFLVHAVQNDLRTDPAVG
jgi:hypothetical protein